MEHTSQGEWLTVEQVAERLQVHVRTVRNWIGRGELAAAFLSKKAGYRIRSSDLDAFMDARMTAASKEGAVREDGRLAPLPVS